MENSENEATLPGLDLPTENNGRIGPNVSAVTSVVSKLNARGALTSEHDDYVQAALTLAGYVDRLPSNAKPYAVAQLMAQYLEGLKSLHSAPGETENVTTEDGVTLMTAINAMFTDSEAVEGD